MSFDLLVELKASAFEHQSADPVGQLEEQTKHREEIRIHIPSRVFETS